MAEKIGARKSGSFKAIATAPSFNKTPVGETTPPLPYVTYQDLSNSVGTSPNVRFNAKPAYLLDQTQQPNCQGDAPGVCKGVRFGHVGGPVKPTSASFNTHINGKCVVREGDSCTLNGGENPGIYLTTPAPGVTPPKNAAQASPPTVKPETPQEKTRWEKTKEFFGDMAEGWKEHTVEEVDAELSGDMPPAAVKMGQSAGKNFGRIISQMMTNQIDSFREGNLPGRPHVPSVGIQPGKPRGGSKPAKQPPGNRPVHAEPSIGNSGFRVQGTGGGGGGCGIKPYKDQKCPAGQQAHHIVPDYALRYGTRNDAASRIPGMPSLDDGPSICLSGGSKVKGSDHNAAHRGTDPRVHAAGQRTDNGPPGLATIGEILDISAEEVSKVKPHCKDEIKAKVDEAFKNVDRSKYGRTTQQPPKKGSEGRATLERGESHGTTRRIRRK